MNLSQSQPMSLVRPKICAHFLRINYNQTQYSNMFPGDKNLVQSLIRDAMVIKELDAHMQHASHHNQ